MLKESQMNNEVKQLNIVIDKIAEARMANRDDIKELETRFDSNMEHKYNQLLKVLKYHNQLIELQMSNEIKNLKSDLGWKLEMAEYRIAEKIKDVEYQVKDSAKVLSTYARTTTNNQDNWSLVRIIIFCISISLFPILLANIVSFWFIH